MAKVRARKSGGGWPAIWYTLRKARAVGLRKMWRALRSRNACKTCALGMGGQLGGMTNEKGRFPEVCKKSVQAMAADLQGAIHEHFFSDFSLEQLKAFTSRELEAAGRITKPLYAGPLDSHYRAISWDEAIDKIARKLKKTDPHEAFFYFSGRSSNEAGFLMQLFARLWGTNNVNNCSYYCHQASGVGLSSVTGSGTATITLDDLDLLGSTGGRDDVLFLIGANPASNHPRFMRTLSDLKRRGGKVIVINPLKEIGLVKFKVPSDVRSLLFGSKIANEYVQPNIGGDIAVLSGIAKALLACHPREGGNPVERTLNLDSRLRGNDVRLSETSPIDHQFLTNYADGWDEFRAHIESLKWNDIIHRSGVSKAQIEYVAQLYANANRAIFCWAMGITHHEHGVANVQMIANLAMMRGMLGAPGKGLLPLRGHSNVQGIGSMGVTPQLKQAIFDKLERELNVKLPDWPGWDTLTCIHKAHEGEVRFASCLGGNLFGSNPDAKFTHEAMSAIDMVAYMSTTLNTGHAWGRGRETIILPVLARDEEPQPTTQESMFNYVRLSEGGEARHSGAEGPRSEIDVIAAIASATLDGSIPIDWKSLTDHSHIRQLIARIIPGYEKLGEIDQTRKEFTISGRIFHQPTFATDTGRAKMHVVPMPKLLGERGITALQPGLSSPPGSDSQAASPAGLRMMTIRSEGQFNTVVYEEEDIYRGQERRDVILMNTLDIDALGLQVDERVTIRSQTGALPNIRVREVDVPAGNCAMYYPEANVLAPRIADEQSRTPCFKSILVWVEPAIAEAAQPVDAARSSHASHARGSSRARMKSC